MIIVKRSVQLQQNVGKIERNYFQLPNHAWIYFPIAYSQQGESRGEVHVTLSFFVNLQQKR